MKEPYLNDFGLTEALIERQARRNKNFNKLILIISYLLLLLYIIIVFTKGDLGGAIFLLIIGVVLVMIFVLIVTGIHEGSGKINRSVNAYNKAVKEYSDYQQRLKEDFWYSLSGLAFENEMIRLFNERGFKAFKTKRTGDEGVDIIIENEDQTVTVVQCKAQKNPVGSNVVSDLYGTMVSMQARDGILINLSGFTKEVYAFIRGKNIKLMNVNDLIKLHTEE